MATKSRYAVVIGAGFLQQPLVIALKSSGYKTIVFDKNPEAYAAGDADFFYDISTRDSESIITQLKNDFEKINICLTSGTDMSATVADINFAFQLIGVQPSQAAITTDKIKMRQFIESLKLPQPTFLAAKTRKQAEEFILQNPCEDGYVLKPAHNMGARGVMLIESAPHLAYAYEYASSQSVDGQVIIEHNIPGNEYSVDALAYQGRVYLTGLADRHIELTEKHFFIETGHTMPSVHYNRTRGAVLELLQKFTDGLSSLTGTPYTGALKGDIREDNSGQFYIGEIASRLSGGFMSTHTYPGATDNNLMQALIELHENNLPAFISENRHETYKQVCIERAMIAQPGRLEQLRLPATPEVKHTMVHFKPGAYIPPLKSNVGKLFNIIIVESTYEQAQKTATDYFNAVNISINPVAYQRKDISKKAKKKFNPDFCWVCRVCDGVNCASGIPGMGGAGTSETFRQNIDSLKNIFILPGYLEKEQALSVSSEQIEPDTSSELFEETFTSVIFSAPITGGVTNMGGSISEYDYAYESASGVIMQGALPFFGDGATPGKYYTGLHIIEQLGKGIPVFKPRKNRSHIMQRIEQAQQSGATAWATDIDAVNLKTMQNRNEPTARLSSDELKNLIEFSEIPAVIKGIMSKEDAAIAAAAGAQSLVISNHGGRIFDGMPSTAYVLEDIAGFIKANYPMVSIGVDGGIRSGADVFKMLALGADYVLIGRPLVIATVAYGRTGAASLLYQYNEELKQIMRVLGLKKISDINLSHLTKSK